MFYNLHISFNILWDPLSRSHAFFCLSSWEVTECLTRNRYLINNVKFNFCFLPITWRPVWLGFCNANLCFSFPFALHQLENWHLDNNKKNFTLQYPLQVNWEQPLPQFISPTIENWFSYNWYLINVCWVVILQF